MLKQVSRIVGAAEEIARQRGLAPALAQLRRLSLADFGRVLLEMPLPEYPTLSGVLPRMASVDVQQGWTGSSGQPLLNDTVTFTRILWFGLQEICGRSLRDAQVLEFGCGYGRILRLLSYFTDPYQIYGVDPYDRSIEICRQDGVLGHLAQSGYLPSTLPVGEARFDLIYAYSVFTHLSLRATRTALETLRRYIKPTGLLAITVRPREFWDEYPLDPETASRLKADHEMTGFAFTPHNMPPVDGDITYGDTSIEIDWIERQFPEWTVRKYDRGLDQMQTIIFLTPT